MQFVTRSFFIRVIRVYLQIVFVAALFTFPAKTVNACSCLPTRTVLDEFTESEVVIIGRVLSVEKVEAKDTDNDEQYVDNVRSTTVRIEKVYKGNVRVRDEIVFGQGGGADCIWTFNEKQIGHEYLLYLNKPKPPTKLWYAGVCGRSRGVTGATEDLLYLDNIKKLRGKTRVSGNLGVWNSDFDVANKKIRIFNEKKSFETKTDKNGVYEIYGLPPGKYRLEPEMPKGWRIARYWLRYSTSAESEQNSPRSVAFKLDDKKHASIDISFEPDNTVEGSIVGPNGSPMPEVCVYLWRPEQSEIFGPSDCTDKQGNFRIEAIPAGSYHLVLQWSGKPTSKEPFAKIFYPGVAQREDAALITVGDGETVKGINVVIPKLVETITVEGVLHYSDDKPVSEENVYFTANQTYGDDGNESERTDAAGKFKLKIIKGVKGEVFSRFFVYPGIYENCPKVDALIKESGQRFVEIKTPEITIEGNQDVFDLVLKLPFPACKRKQ